MGLSDDFLRNHKADSLLATTLRSYEGELFTVRKRAETHRNREKEKDDKASKKDRVVFNVLLGWNHAAGRPISFDKDIEARLRQLRSATSYEDLKATFHEQKEYTTRDNGDGTGGGTGGKRTVQVLEFQGGHNKRRKGNNDINRPSPPRYVADKRASSF